MLNLQNNATYQYVFNPIMQKRADGKIIAAWIESAIVSPSSVGNRRIGVCVINENGTIAHATAYTPNVNFTNLLNLDLTIDPLDNYIYLGLYSLASSSLTVYGYKFDASLNLLSSMSQNSTAYHRTLGFIWVDSTFLYTHIPVKSGLSQYLLNKNTFGISIGASASGQSVVSKSVLQTEGSNIGVMTGYSTLDTVHRVSNGAFPVIGTTGITPTNSTCVRLHNNMKYIFQTLNTTKDFYYNIVNEAATVLSSVSTISGIFLNNTDIIRSIAKSGLNTIWITTSGGELIKLQQDLITGELSFIDKTTCSATEIVVGVGSSVYLVSHTNTYLVKFVDINTLATSIQINITTGSGFTPTNFLEVAIPGMGDCVSCYKNNNNSFLENPIFYTRERGLIINEPQKFHNLIYANNGPGGVNNINYQKTELIFGYATSGTKFSKNHTVNFNSFKFIPNYNLPTFTDINFFYSLNNGGSWTEITLGMENTEISAPSSTQIKIKSEYSTLDTTGSPEDLDYALELIV